MYEEKEVGGWVTKSQVLLASVRGSECKDQILVVRISVCELIPGRDNESKDRETGRTQTRLKYPSQCLSLLHVRR